MSLDNELLSELTESEDLDAISRFGDDSSLLQGFNGYLGSIYEVHFKIIQVHNGELFVVDIAEALLDWKSSLDRRLTTFKVGVNLSPSLLTFGTSGGGFTHTRTYTSGYTSLFERAAGTWLKIMQTHC